MLCSWVVCTPLSVVISFVIGAFWERRNQAEPVVSREDSLELQKDVHAVGALAVVSAVLCMSYLLTTLFKKPAPEPEPQQPWLEDLKEEKQHKEELLRRPSEHKETQYQIYDEVQYVTVETQTSDSFLPVEWTSSESQFSDSSLSMMSPPLDSQMNTSSLGTSQQAIADVETNGTSPNYPQSSTAQEILQKETSPNYPQSSTAQEILQKETSPNYPQSSTAQEIQQKETTLESMVQEVLELQVSKGPQKSEGQRGNRPIGNVATPVGSPRSETSGKTTSPRATDPQLHAATPKPQLPTGAGDFETPPHSASDASSPEADSGLRMMHKPAAHSPRKPVTFTVSLESDQSPRRSAPPPGSPGRTASCLPIPKAGFRRRVCSHCRSRDECQRTADGSRPTTATAMAAPPSTSPRGAGDADVSGVASRLPAPGRVCRLHPPSTIKGRPPPGQTYSDLHCRQGAPCARPTPAYACRPPSYEDTNQ